MAGLAPGVAHAHPARQALVLLMPTDLYIGIGTGIVAVTALLLGVVPMSLARRTPGPPTLAAPDAPDAPDGRAEPAAPASASLLARSLLVSGGLAMLLALGVHGPQDPLANLLPLSVWTLWWIGIVTLFGLLGASYRPLNPWSGVIRHVLRQPAGSPGARKLPERWGDWPGVVTLLLISGFVLADPAPDDPARLAGIVTLWWAATLLMMLAVGERAWLTRGEAMSMLIARFAALSPWQRGACGTRRFGMPGRALLDAAWARRGARPGAAVFCLVLLGSGSFDGLVGTFAWLDLLGVNPLAYPGRSALVSSTLIGLVLFNALLVALFALAVRLGSRWAGTPATRSSSAFDAFNAFAPSVLPIAFAYHVAHYLPGLLVNGQYALVALGDPLGGGHDPFGLGPWFVSTGFFNTPASVAAIWFAQAAAVVIGHIVSIVLAHAIAQGRYPDQRRALLCQLPMVAFMLGYTLFGLWLLAAPRGA